MPKFRKKPVVVEAEQWFPGKHVDGVGTVRFKTDDGQEHVSAWIFTLEGRMEVSPGDWIITGVRGEKYPCKPDIFEATYEPADTPPTDSSAAKAEVARLRAENERYRKALERIAEIDIPYAPMTDHSVMRFYEQVAREALASTPTEPSRAERGATEVYVVRNRDKDILYVGFDWNEVESLLAQDASNEYLSYGIKAPEKEDEFE